MEINSLHKVTPGQRLKVAAYARVSSDKDLLEASLNEQIDFYTRLIIQNTNWDFAGIYYDDGISGTTISIRKSFKKMIGDAKAGLIDIILVKSVSRFARNLIDLLEVVREFRKLGIEIYFESQHMSSLDVKCDQMITLYAQFAEEEAISASKNQKWRLDVDRKNGRYYIPVNKMLGYRYDGKGNLVIQEDEAKIVRLIYWLYLDDVGTASICDYLTRNGIKNRRGIVSWSISSVRNILHNEKYVGDCLLQKTYSEDPLTKKKVYNHGQRDQYYITNGHIPIIDRETWNAVQNKFNAMGEKYHVRSEARVNMIGKRYRYSFNNFILCPYCGKYYMVKTNHYNGAITNKHLTCYSNHQAKLCKSENYPFITFKEILAKQTKILKSNISSFREVLIDEYSSVKEEPIQPQIDALNSQIESLRNKYNDIKNHHDDFFTSLQNETIQEINELIAKRSSLQQKIVSSNPSQRAKEIINALKALPDDFDDIENIDFKTLFSKAIIVNKELIYFIISDTEIKEPPLNPKLYFKSAIEYKVRKSRFTTQFGIAILN